MATTSKLTPTRVAIINKLMEDIRSKWTIYGLHKALERDGFSCAYSAVHKFVTFLHSNGYLMREKREFRISNAPGFVNLLAIQRPLHGKRIVPYHSRADLEKRMNFFKDAGRNYSFTSFVGGNLYQQYVMTDKIHVYISPTEFNEYWKPLLKENGYLPVESGPGNVFFVVDPDESALALNDKVQGYNVAPKATLVADLLSTGGLGEELGLMLMEGFKWIHKSRKFQKGT